MTIICISGSRLWDDEDKIEKALEHLTPDDIIVHGGAKGADLIADKICQRRGIKTIVIRPVKSQKIYYLHRNAEMIGMCDHLIAFWDGRSKGTEFTINYARLRQKSHTIIRKGMHESLI